MTLIVLFGGQSDERHVSVASAQNIASHLDAPLCWFWAPNGAVHDVAPDELLRHANPFLDDYVPSRPAIWPDIEQALDTLPVEDPIFVLALHGGAGEDGTLQRMLERRGIPFTGSGSEASAVAFDKERAKERLRGHVAMAESRVANDESIRDMFTRHEKLVLKPVAGGSSRGLYFVTRHDEIPELEVSYMVEQFLSGRELTVGVVEGVALPVLEVEIDPGRDFDYDGKYLGKGSHEICPARIPDSMRDAVQRAGVIAHERLGCDGYSRTDVVAADDGTVYFLETNTLPGMTKASLVPQELAAAGISMRDFLDRQVTLALQRSSRAPRSSR